MKCTLIVDSLGPNPDFNPPRRDEFADDEAFHDALALYNVPADVTVPAGTLLSDPLAWMHCLPDQSGWGRDKDGRAVRIRPGVVRAVPIDEPCKARMAKEIQKLAAARKVTTSVILQEVDAGVKRSQAAQADNAAAVVSAKPAA